MKPIVAIVGRPNAGKSTLFNKIIGRKKAIVADEPGVTRDLNFADAQDSGRVFTVVDTGGFESGKTDYLLHQVKEQTRLAIEEADVIIFLMDGKSGVSADDAQLVGILRKSGQPVVYAVNKIDSVSQTSRLTDFYSLGIKEIFPVSAEQGTGVNELVEEVVKRLPASAPQAEEEGRIRVAIVGRPNVGKSSLLNKLVGKPRAIVSDVAGTTRDPVDTPFARDGKKYLFVDTAGIRKKNRVSLLVENYCVMEAIKTIGRCDAAILVMDAKAGTNTQDERLAGIIEDRKKNCIIAVNKWDLAEDKDTDIAKHVEGSIRRKMPFISYAPVVFVSALVGTRVSKIFDLVDGLVEKSSRRLKTSELNKILEETAGRHHPPSYRGKEVKFYYAAQTGVSPPEFVIFTNHPEGVDEPYKRYMMNTLREAAGMDGCPLKVYYRKRE
ncbi:MAG: ribosome biogenesis GTPase Der [Deltaproteobacteria bacterium]|nr:ribosome biogenesis GTPase Der [Deltaproteobacteria bacterium]